MMKRFTIQYACNHVTAVSGTSIPNFNKIDSTHGNIRQLQSFKWAAKILIVPLIR